MWDKVEPLGATEDQADDHLTFTDLGMLAMASTMAVCAVILFIVAR